MYNIKLENYVPEPKPATSDRIVAAHYYAAWKKGAARIHEAFDDLHDYPERTPLHGYYDEENPELCDWEIKWALEHGINCFIYCWYRNLDNMGKPITVNDLRCGHCLHEALFNAKYGKMMKFAIMFENSPRWGTTDPEDIIENVMPFWMENYFKRENYLIIDNKPVVFVFSAQRLLEALGGIEGQAKAFEACREYARKHGFDGMLFAKQDWHTSEQIVKDDIASGYDIRFGYNSGYAAPYNFPPEEDVVNAQLALLRKKINDFPMGFVPTASCFSDATPRTTQHWIDMGYGFHKQTIY